jgi:integrase
MANDTVGALRVIFGWAVEAEHMESNPARDIKQLRKDNPDGYHTWEIEEVEQFESTHAVGTQARLALGCLLYSGQRASDAIRLGKDKIRIRTDEDGKESKWLVFTQHKNRNRKPVHMEIPLRPELEELIDGTPGAMERETFLTQTRGKPHTRVSFTKDFGAACIAAKVPGRSHGLRKAAAVRLAENGATEKEIASITGHQTLAEITRYTKRANQKKLAARATKKVTGKRTSVNG